MYPYLFYIHLEQTLKKYYLVYAMYHEFINLIQGNYQLRISNQRNMIFQGELIENNHLQSFFEEGLTRAHYLEGFSNEEFSTKINETK